MDEKEKAGIGFHECMSRRLIVAEQCKRTPESHVHHMFHHFDNQVLSHAFRVSLQQETMFLNERRTDSLFLPLITQNMFDLGVAPKERWFCVRKGLSIISVLTLSCTVSSSAGDSAAQPTTHNNSFPVN